MRGFAVALSLFLLASTGLADASEAVRTRAGLHPGFGRMVFDWRDKVGYEVQVDGGSLVVTFDRPFTSSLAAAEDQLVNYIGPGVRSDDGRTVTFPLRRTIVPQSFVLRRSVVVDLYHSSASAPVQRQRAPAPRAATVTAAVSAADKMKPAEPADSVTAVASASTQSRGADVTDAKNEATIADAAEPVPESVPEPAPEPVALPSIQPAPAETPSRPTGTAHAQAAAAAGDDGPDKRRVAAPRWVAEQPEPAVTGVATPPGPAVAAPRGPVVDVGFTRKGDAFSLSFPGLGGAGASVFSRAGAAWVVFDRVADLRLAGLKATAPELAGAATVIGHPAATVLRMEEPGEGLVARRDGSVWVVDFGVSGRPPYRPLSVQIEPAASPDAGLVIAAEAPGQPVALVDPEAGDRLIVVPLATPETGLADAQEYPEVQLLATAQGVAAVQRSDDLRVSVEPERVRITTNAGLLLSRVPASRSIETANVGVESPQAAAAPEARIDRLLDLTSWQRAGESFNEVRQELERAVLMAGEKGAGEEGAGAARLDLARFYLARGLAAEALGVMEAGGAEIASIAGPAEFHAMRGAANLLTHRLEAAEADLSHADLADSAEAALWRGALHARRSEWAEADPLFDTGWALAEDYPKWLRQELGLRAAEAALDQGGSERAARYLSAARGPDAPQAVMSRARFLEGRVLAERGDTLDALALWGSVSRSADQLAHAKAELAAVKLGLQEGVIDHDEAIDRLERLRFAWRGDAVEFETLTLLGRSYLAAGDYTNGFGTLREAVTLFSDTLDTAPATELMTAAFRRLFVDGNLRDLPPLRAVSLYEEFRELTPIGEEGDRVIRDLAARLVSLDLLEPAAELLDNQVRYRLDGDRRARTGADLALILLLDRKPSEAVDVLRKSAVEGLPDELAARRRHLLARGLWDMGKPDEALGTLASDRSPEAEALRGDIYWKAGRWAEAAATLGRMAGGLTPAALSEADGRLVLEWGVALALAKDSAGLRRIAGTFGKAMIGTPHEAAFGMITSGRPASGASLATITETLTDVGDFQGYLKGYRNALEASAALAPPALTPANGNAS